MAKKKPYTGIMHRSYDVYNGPMDKPYEIDHVLAAEYVGREDALRFVLAVFEERRLEVLKVEGKLNPKDHPDLVIEIEAARVAAGEALEAAESEFSAANATHRSLKRQRNRALRDREIMKMTRQERELREQATAAREGTRKNGRIGRWGYETYLNNRRWAELQGTPLSQGTLDRHEQAITELQDREANLLEQAAEVGELRASTVVEVQGYPPSPWVSWKPSSITPMST